MSEQAPKNPKNVGRQEHPTPGNSPQPDAKPEFLTPEQLAEAAAAWDMAVSKGLKGTIIATPGRMIHISLYKPKS